MGVTHVSAAAILMGLESVPGTAEVLTAGVHDFPNTITDSEFPYGDREINEAEGPSSRILQGQELISFAYPFNISYQLYDPSMLDAMLYSDVLGDMPSYTFYLNHGSSPLVHDLGKVFWGAKCDRWVMHLAENEVVSIDSDWIACHNADLLSGFSWTVPTGRKPFVFAGATWSIVGGGGGDILSCDFEVRNNLQAHYPMQDTLPATDLEYDPKYLTPKNLEFNVDMRMLSAYDVDFPMVDNYEAVIALRAGPIQPTPSRTLTITLVGGALRSQRIRVPQRDFIEYTLPLRFRTISTYTWTK
jgi:hypothetical protein